MKVDSLCTACESELDLSSASLSAVFGKIEIEQKGSRM